MTPEILAADIGWPYSKAKTAVLAAAAAVIREGGPRSATLKNIANRAGITEPAIFRHFDGVDGLFHGLFQACERVYDLFAAAFDNGEKGFPRLRTAMTKIIDYMAAAQDLTYVLIHMRQVFRGYPELRTKISELSRRDQEKALACIVAGIEAGEIRGDIDPLTLATIIIATVEMTAILWIESDFAFDLREVCEHRWEDLGRLMAHNPALGKPSPRAKRTKAELRSLVGAFVKRGSRVKAKVPAAKAKTAVPKASAKRPKAPSKAKTAGRPAKTPKAKAPKAKTPKAKARGTAHKAKATRKA
jgi:TetR/AcrR family fatty acid metabolism transcriptional regulator